MAGFGSVAATQAAVGNNGTTSVVSSTNLLQANLTAGVVVLTWTVTYRAAGAPPSVTGVAHSSGFTGTAPAKLLHYDDGFGRVELWWARATANANANVSTTVTFSGTSDSSNMIAVRPFSGFPTNWEIRNSATHSRSANATSHPCGSVTAEINDMIVTASILTSSRGTGTAAAGFDGFGVSTWGWAQWIKAASGMSTDAAWSSANSRGTAGMAIVLTESGAVATMQPRVMFVL